MSTISIYPKTFALFNLGNLSVTEPCGLLLLTSDYVFDEEHEDVTNIDEEWVVADLNLSTLHYEEDNNTFTAMDVIVPNLEADVEIAGAILYRQANFDVDSKLIWFSDDIEGFPLVTTGETVVVTFPSGVLVVAPTGYTAPDMASYEAEGASPFNAQIEQDVTYNLFNTNEFASSVFYTHGNGTRTTYAAIKTATPEISPIGELEIASVAQTIKLNNSELRYTPRRGDSVILEGVGYTVAGIWSQNYTTDVYLHTTVRG